MTVLPVLGVGLVMKVIGVLFLLCAVALILIVLIQKGKGGGLSSAFGGGMAGGILGSKTGDVLTWVTIGLVSVLLLLALIMDKWYRPIVREQAETTTSLPATSPAPAPTPGADAGAATGGETAATPQGDVNTAPSGN